MAEYDTISKHLIQTYPKDFIRFTLGQDNVEVLNILDTETRLKHDILIASFASISRARRH